jgi:hypothetical protein
MDSLTQVVLDIVLQYRSPETRVSRKVMLAQVNEALRMDMRDDKPIREAVNWLRANHPQGCYIVSSLDGGMFVARSRAEAKEYMAPDWSRVSKLSQRLRAQDALMERNEAPQWVQETKQMEMAI